MSPRLFPSPLLAAGTLCCAVTAVEMTGAEQAEARRSYNLPRGDAATTLSQFAGASGSQLVFMMDKVRGQQTNAVKGEYSPREVLDRMLAGTALSARQDQATGAFVIMREAGTSVPASSPPEAELQPRTTEDRPKPMKRKNIVAAVVGWLALAISSPNHAQTVEDEMTGTIEGRVFNSSSGEYIERARLTVDGTSLETFTGIGGQYRFTGVPAGVVNVRAFFTGVEGGAQTVTLSPGATVRLDLTLGQPRAGAQGEVVELSSYVVGVSREMDGAALAINEQRFAPNITNVVSAGEFGVSADGSVGEFLKFLPGISVDYVGGTANTISMGGVPANYVPVTVGGFDLASTSSASTARSSELLQISIHNAARLEVLHSPTPESPGSALAGSVNIVPRSAFERSRPLFTGSVYVMMRDNYRDFEKTPGPGKDPTHKIQPGFDFSYIRPVNARFGFTLSGSYSRQFIPQDTAISVWRGAGGATNGVTASGSATQYPHTTPDQPYLTDYTITDNIKFNDRSSFGTTVDYKLSENDTLSFSYQYGSFGSENNGNTINFLVNRVAPGNHSTVSTRGEAGRGEINVNNNSRWRDGETHMPTLVYRHNGPVWNAEAGVGYSHSTNYLRDVERGYFGGLNGRRTGVTVSFDDNSYLRPGRITVSNADGTPVDPFDLGSYVLTSASSPHPRDSIDIKRSAYANLRRDFSLRGIPVTLKGGLDVRNSERDMTGSNSSLNFVGADGRATTTPLDPNGSDDRADFLLDDDMSQRFLPFGFPQLGVMSADQALEFYRANPGYFVGNANTDYRNAVGLSKWAEETVSSLFLRADLAFFDRKLKLVGGVRAEQTNVKAKGPLTDLTRNFQRDAAGNPILGGNGRPLPIATDPLEVSRLTYLERGMTAEKEYLRYFPSINASFNIRENLVVRGSTYDSIGRPNYNQYAGGITLPDTELAPGSSNRIVVNNVAIKPWSANTIKVRLEYYFKGVGQLSAGAFRRDFDNFFASSVSQPTPEFLALYSLDPGVYGVYDVSTQFNLGTKVRMTGHEFDYKQALTFLPHWARGIQVFANVTVLRTEGESEAEFSGFVPRTSNWGLSLNRKRFNVRANWNYQGRRRLNAITGSSIEPGTYEWRLSRLSLDVQGEYQLGRGIALFANLRNLTNAREEFERAGPSTPAHAKFRRIEDFGSSWTFGVRGTF